MKQTLNLKLSQQLTLTPQLKQSLRLLQLPSLDLDHEIQLTLDSNPLLERIEENTELQESAHKTQASASIEVSNNNTDLTAETDHADQLAPEQDLSINWQESVEVQRTNFETNTSSNNLNENTEFTQFVSKEETLFEHLYWQVQMTALSDKDKLIARALLRSLDDDAYLNVELEEICGMLDPELETDVDEVSAILSFIKTLEPIGIGARDLSERLTMQLEKLSNQDNDFILNNAKTIVSKHFDLLASRNTTKLKKQLALSDEELSESLSLITTLNPRITNQFSNDNQDQVIPDLIISKQDINGKNVWVANLNTEAQAKLRVNKTYSDLLKSGIDKQGSEYIQQNLVEAKTFIKNLMSRYDTLLLVGQAIVERQQAFFENGAEHMQPMVRQDIADELEMHESTISRATSGKYLLSPLGVVELKYFFSSAVSNTDGATSSSTAIRSLIKKMVDSESKKKPLSDNKIAQELENQGHIVARRTVAKYRESMQIAPSSQRKSLI